MVSKYSKLIAITFIIAISIYSCAKIGTPSGGPKDVTPPKVVESKPAMNAINFNGKKVVITFDEFVQLSDITKNFVASPPMKKRPSILLRNKSVIVELEDSLKANSTYRLYFGNAIVDNNEKNPLKDYEFVFSTGNKIDSLSIRGRVIDAFDHKPESKESFYVMLYNKFQDSIPRKILPEYITKTDDKGWFSITHVRPDTFMIFALKDLNQNNLFDLPNEPIAFADTLISMNSARYFLPDSLIKPDTIGVDSMNRAPFKSQITLYSFTESHDKQYLKKYERLNLEKIDLIFNVPIFDSVQITPLNFSGNKWIEPDRPVKNDTMSYWITDSIALYMDTLKVKVGYSVYDSLERIIPRYDTISLVYKRPLKAKSKGTLPPLTVSKFGVVCSADNQMAFDLNNIVTLTANHPLVSFDINHISLVKTQDEKKTNVKFKLIQDSILSRKYYLNFKLEPQTDYQLVADSMTFKDIYGLLSDSLGCKFKTQKDDYYSKITLKLKNVREQMIVQLITEKGDLVQQKIINTDQDVVFGFLHPGKYKFKAIYDKNKNKIWDTGNFAKKLQPEKVVFNPKIIPVRSNFDMEEDWELE
jgi:hypothetical protein